MIRDHALQVRSWPSQPPPCTDPPSCLPSLTASGPVASVEANGSPPKAKTATAAASTLYWRRTVPYPSSITFDASSAARVCLPQRIATNTPLHALTTLNDPVYYEASQALAKRMLDA